MGHLAFIGSHRVNGVSALHTKLMRETVFADLHRLYPERIVNKTNGITFRRWLHQANPRLTRLLREVCGDAVSRRHRRRCARLAEHADDPAVIERLAAVKRANKTALSRFVYEQTGAPLDPNALFDVHIKRIHEYKRQLLNLLDTVARYHAIRADPGGEWVPRVKIFAGKAAASYAQAKMIIKLANDIAAVINRDPATRDLLRLVFLPNYNVSLAEMIIPAADLSEQISTAGMEASGTGNMKLALNGALTIGTLDGANVEIREHVGAENIFIFGLTAERGRSAAAARSRRRRRDRRFARACRGARRDRGRRVLAGRPRPVPPHRRPAPLCRSLYDRGRFRRVPRGAGGGRGAVDAAGSVGPRRRPQHRPDRMVFVRPHDRRIRRRHLERAGRVSLTRRGAQPGDRNHSGSAAEASVIGESGSQPGSSPTVWTSPSMRTR